MAHAAEIREGDIVGEVIVLSDADVTDENGVEQDALAQRFVNEELGKPGEWIRCSFNGTFRRRMPSKDYTFDRVRDAFIPKKPSETWVFDETTLDWVPPIPRPAGIPIEHVIWWEDLQYWGDRRLVDSPAQFLLRFRQQETDAMQASQDPVIQEVVAAFHAAPYVRRDSEITIWSLQILVSAGILPEHRADEILTG